MRYIIVSSWLLTLCCCGSVRDTELPGIYKIYGNTNRIASLEIYKGGSYKFCYVSCVRNNYKIWIKPSDGKLRIRFYGEEIEDYARKLLSDGFGENALYPPVGSSEHDVENSISGPLIDMEPEQIIYFRQR